MNTLIQQRFSDPQFEEHISKLKSELLTSMEVRGKEEGEQNRPNTVGEFRTMCINQMQSKIQELLIQNQERFMPVSGMVIANRIRQECKEKVLQLRGPLSDARYKLEMLKAEARACKERIVNNPWRKLVYVCLGAIALSEAWLAYPAFRYSHFDTGSSITIAMAIAMGVGLGAHFLGGFVKKSKSKLQYCFRYAIASVPYAVGFALIGHLRATALNNGAPDLSATEHFYTSIPQSVSGWALGAISFFLYWLALFLSIYFYKSKEERKAEQEYKNKMDEVAEQENTVKTIKGDIEALESDAEVKAGVALQTFEYALAKEAGLISFASQPVDKFIDTNLRFRTDGTVPEMFGTPPPFNFQTFFDRVKPNNNEKD